MRIVPALSWALDGHPPERLDGRLLPLLRAIAAGRSLAAAVAELGISYRAAWGLLRDFERKLGAPLVVLERGRGASLAPFGERLLRADVDAARRLARILPRLAVETAAAAERGPRAAVPALRLAASHDLALAALAKALPEKAGITLDVAFMGSLRALDEYAEGRAQVAGFHVPIDGRVAWDRTPFASALSARRDRLIRFVDRDQGLILPRANPARVRTLRDVATHGLRFVNRQRGSGTRLLVDQMIAAEGVDPGALAGYGNEEFTHPAVAATVASGGADAGFGLRAAASEYGLAFVPLVKERYFLAVRRRELAAPIVARLVRVLRSRTFARIALALPGYDPQGAGSIVSPDALAGALPT